MKFNIVANGKIKKVASILEMANHKAKRSKIWDSRPLIVLIWGIYVVPNVILGHSVQCF